MILTFFDFLNFLVYFFYKFLFSFFSSEFLIEIKNYLLALQTKIFLTHTAPVWGREFVCSTFAKKKRKIKQKNQNENCKNQIQFSKLQNFKVDNRFTMKNFYIKKISMSFFSNFFISFEKKNEGLKNQKFKFLRKLKRLTFF